MRREFFKNHIVVFFFFVACCLLLLLLGKFAWLNRFQSWLSRPILAAQERIWQRFTDRPASKGEQGKIAELEDKLKAMAIDRAQLSACQEENKSLKKILGAPLPKEWNFLPAKAIGFVDGRLKLNVGKRQGVDVGMIVLSENFLVGKISKAGEDDSFVDMPITRGVKIPVAIRPVGGNRVATGRGIITGNGDLDLVLDKVLQEEKIAKGDLVVSFGESGWEPDLVIGQVEEIISRTVDVWQKAKVLPLLDYRRLKDVYLLYRK